jgi:arylformamidase
MLMPYVLSPMIGPNSQGMWFEGTAYEKRSIYSIASGKAPPVNYDEHILRPHSLTHIETPAHTIDSGKRLDSYYKESLDYFYGRALVLRLSGNNYSSLGNGIFQWIILVKEIEERIEALGLKELPHKILITSEFYPLNTDGYHDPNYVLTLSQEAADYLISIPGFNLYGTSWKSSDYNPGRPERPIHNTIFKKALILENLDLKNVPEGIYFLSAFPLPLRDASESPVVPVLFSKEELFY